MPCYPNQAKRRIGIGGWLLGWMLPVLLAALSAPGWSEPLPRQVLIEAQVWELSDEKGFDWGVIWDYNKKESSNPGDFDIFSANLRLPIFDESGDVPPRGLFISGDILDLKYGILNLRIQAALREGRAELLSNPKIVTLEGRTATIHSGEKVPIIRFEYDSAGRQTLNTVFEDTGVKLVVRPDIHHVSQEYVILDIRPEVKEIARFEKLTSPDGEFELPLLTKRTAQSKVVVRSGETLIIGGLYREQTLQNERGIPFAKDVPWVGGLFRNKTKTMEKRDLLIEVRPTILLPGRGSFLPAPFTSGPRSPRRPPTTVDGFLYGGEVPPMDEPDPFEQTPQQSAPRARSTSSQPSGSWY